MSLTTAAPAVATTPSRRAALAEWAFPLALSVLVVLLTSIPYAAALQPGRDNGYTRYTGAVINYKDYNGYLAMMRQGLSGSWHYRLAYTSEPHEGAVIYVFFLTLGHIAGLTGLEPVVVFHLARVATSLLMFVAAWWLIRRVLAERAAQRTAFALVALASGLGWLGLALGAGANNLPDMFMPEAIPFFTTLYDPHYPLALALFIFLTGAILLPVTRRGLRALAIVLLAPALATVKPYPLLVLFSALALYLLIRLARERRIHWPIAWRAVLAGLAAAPVLGYQYFIASRAPVIAEWWNMNVNLITSPPIWDYALAYAWLLPAAVVGIVWAWRAFPPPLAGGPGGAPASTAEDSNPEGWLGIYLACWAGMNVPWLYSGGFMPQRTFSLGLQVPLALLAAIGWHRVVAPRLRAGLAGRLRLAWIVASTLTNVLVIFSLYLLVLSHNPGLFLRPAEWDGLLWLRAHAGGQVVAASVETSVFIPGWSDARVIAGHPDHTVRPAEKEAALRALFAPAPDPLEQLAILEHYNAEYVWYGPRERALGAPLPRLGREWAQVFAEGDVIIFERVRGRASGGAGDVASGALK